MPANMLRHAIHNCTTHKVNDELDMLPIGLSQFCSVFDQPCYSFMLQFWPIMLQKCTNYAPKVMLKILGDITHELYCKVSICV